jgi:hypothetical protein
VFELNVEDWKEFRIGDLFEIDTGSDLIYNELEDGEYNVVGHKAENNGVTCSTAKLENYTLYNHSEVLSLGHIGNFFCTMQTEDFYLGTRVKALKPKFNKFNKYIGLFLATVINQERYKFNYGRVGSDKVPDLIIKLPALPNPNYNKNTKDKEQPYMPDWQFMEKYIKNIYNKLAEQIETKLMGGGDLKKETWKEFRLLDIFIIKSTKTREIINYDENGDVPFIASGSSNNGVEKFVYTDEKLDKGNCITVSSIDCSSFFQEKDFLGRGHGAVNKIYSSKLNKYNALFLCTILNAEKYRYSYNRQCFLDKLSQTVIKLPALPNPNYSENTKNKEQSYIPDWQFMENYIKQLPYGDKI